MLELENWAGRHGSAWRLGCARCRVAEKVQGVSNVLFSALGLVVCVPAILDLYAYVVGLFSAGAPLFFQEGNSLHCQPFTISWIS